MTAQRSPELAAAIDQHNADVDSLYGEIFTPHTNHPFGACGAAAMGEDLCEECCHDMAISVARAFGQREENERLLAAVLALLKDGVFPGSRDELLALFEVPNV